jgi:hypothetical protein
MAQGTRVAKAKKYNTNTNFLILCEFGIISTIIITVAIIVLAPVEVVVAVVPILLSIVLLAADSFIDDPVEPHPTPPCPQTQRSSILLHTKTSRYHVGP